jgi:8-oxo-dGTP pyrophosphatase MutT (NUDIX family)
MIARVRKAGDPWSGQVAFPGGMREESDRSLLDTAIREAREEVGIKVDRSDILGSLSDVKGHIDVIVTPYVALLKKQQRLVMSEEVESILRVPLETFQRWHFRSIKANDETTLKRRCYVSGNYIIWGLSRRIAEELTKLVSNLPRNSDGQKRTT